VSTSTTQRWYTIKEAAALTGLPASTLRYYESIGVIAPVSRGATSGHRLYDEADLDQLMWVACLAATGMSVSDMREYVANGKLGPAAALEQVRLLEQQQERLRAEAEQLAVRRQYVGLKIDYWQAVRAGEPERAERIGEQARALADELKRRPTS
jgi:DNA-binding transcriptional MerR regulator